MLKLNTLVSSLNSYLEIEKVKEKAINGLQLEVHHHVEHIALAVSVNQRTLDAAKKVGADTLLVHHGLYWGKQEPLTGLIGQRMRSLIHADMNLLAYHLPLDVHPFVGNNRQLGLLLNLEANPHPAVSPDGLVYYAKKNISIKELLKKISDFLNPMSLAYYPQEENSSQIIETIAWCSGAGGDFLEPAAAQCFITGELSERHFDQARELGTILVQAGHYATERAGVQALGQWIEKQFKIKTTFIEAFTPL
jgi:dinuclear metal center YbgI/SA1388 family protein